jgi:hypothetical protein
LVVVKIGRDGERCIELMPVLLNRQQVQRTSLEPKKVISNFKLVMIVCLETVGRVTTIIVRGGRGNKCRNYSIFRTQTSRRVVRDI